MGNITTTCAKVDFGERFVGDILEKLRTPSARFCPRSHAQERSGVHQVRSVLKLHETGEKKQKNHSIYNLVSELKLQYC